MNLDRKVEPIVKARFKAGGVRSVGKDRALTKLAMVTPAINKLEGEAEGFVEIENYMGEVVRLTWNGGYQLELSLRSFGMPREDVDAWVAGFARDGIDETGAPGAAATSEAAAPVTHLIDPKLTLRTERGGVASGLADWQLRQELERLAEPGNRFAVLERGPAHYVQCYINSDGTFDVEYRDGGPSDHYRVADPVTAEEMISIFLEWGSGGDFRGLFSWVQATM